MSSFLFPGLGFVPSLFIEEPWDPVQDSTINYLWEAENYNDSTQVWTPSIGGINLVPNTAPIAGGGEVITVEPLTTNFPALSAGDVIKCSPGSFELQTGSNLPIRAAVIVAGVGHAVNTSSGIDPVAPLFSGQGSNATSYTFHHLDNTYEMSVDGVGAGNAKVSINGGAYEGPGTNIDISYYDDPVYSASDSMEVSSANRGMLLYSIRDFSQDQFLHYLFVVPSGGQPTTAGYILAAAFWTTNPSEDEMRITEGYLAHKYGLVNSLDTNHPFKNNRP